MKKITKSIANIIASKCSFLPIQSHVREQCTDPSPSMLSQYLVIQYIKNYHQGLHSVAFSLPPLS